MNIFEDGHITFEACEWIRTLDTKQMRRILERIYFAGYKTNGSYYGVDNESLIKNIGKETNSQDGDN